MPTKQQNEIREATREGIVEVVPDEVMLAPLAEPQSAEPLEGEVIKQIAEPRANKLKKKPQGKISEKVILRELLKDKPKKLKEIAVLAGSLAKSDDDRSKAVIQKVASSNTLQLALAQARQRGLEVQNALLEKYAKTIEERNDVQAVGPKDRLELVIKTTNAISNLTKQEEQANKSPNLTQINIYADKTDEELHEILRKNKKTLEALSVPHRNEPLGEQKDAQRG